MIKSRAGVFLASILIVGLVACYELEAQSPNIIIILTDDQGYGDVGNNGCQDIPTPNINRIAQNGIKFTNGYVFHAVCGPSLAGLITGHYQDRFGFGRNPILTPEDPTMVFFLSDMAVRKIPMLPTMALCGGRRATFLKEVYECFSPYNALRIWCCVRNCLSLTF